MLPCQTATLLIRRPAGVASSRKVGASPNPADPIRSQHLRRSIVSGAPDRWLAVVLGGGQGETGLQVGQQGGVRSWPGDWNPQPAVYKTAANRPPRAGTWSSCSSGQMGRPASTLQ
jgi:hypothetical protein